MPEFTLPDGRKATLRDPSTLTNRQKRPLQIIIQAVGQRRFMDIVKAQQIAAPDESDNPETVEAKAKQASEAVEALELTRAEWGLLFEMTDATLYALVESIEGIDVPGSPEAMPDLPDDIYEALATQTGKLQAEHMAHNGFGLEAIEDQSSPTGASDGSTVS